MAYLRVYPAAQFGWVLDVQSDLIDRLNVRVVVPLMPLDVAPIPAKRLNPLFSVKGVQVSMVTQYIASVPASILRVDVADLSDERDRVTAALDMLFHGF